jgi:hypothetical protein
MAKTIFYYSVRTYGDGDKGVNIYKIEDNKLVSVGNVDVAWGHSEEEAIHRFIEDKDLCKNFYCQEM